MTRHSSIATPDHGSFSPIAIPGHGSFTPWDLRGQVAGQKTAALISAKGQIAFTRDPEPGHVTGSGFIVSPDRKKTLLLHHRKLGRWLAPGGHCDGEPDARATALREIDEETGLSEFSLARPEIFDIDVHVIPARKDVPEHLHFDIRYLIIANPDLPVPANNESLDHAWVPMDQLGTYTDDPSVLVVNKALTF